MIEIDFSRFSRIPASFYNTSVLIGKKIHRCISLLPKVLRFRCRNDRIFSLRIGEATFVNGIEISVLTGYGYSNRNGPEIMGLALIMV